MSSSLSPWAPHAFLLDNTACVRQPGSPATRLWDPLGVFWERKKERPEGALEGGRPTGTKQRRAECSGPLCEGQGLAAWGEGGSGWEGLSYILATLFFALVRKATAPRLQRIKYIWTRENHLPECSFWTRLASLDIPWEKASHSQGILLQ